MAINENVFGSPDSVRLPPDSSGKRTSAFKNCIIQYNNGVADIRLNDILVGGTTGAKGTVVEVATNNTQGTGHLLLVCAKDGLGVIFEVGEDLNLEGGGKVAEVQDKMGVYTPAHHLVGGNNPHNTQFVDRSGSAYVRFDEGPQQLDAFGLTRYTTPWMVGFYEFHYDTLPYEFQQSTTGTAAITHLPDQSSVELSVGADAGDKSCITSHKYHLYQPGYSQLIEITAVVGDPGTVGNRRRIGYFDDENGVFFELDDQMIYATLRSNVTGSVVEERVPMTEWNGDKADGSGGLDNLSGMALNPTNVQIMWIDLQWLGAGRVRFGFVNDDGIRITAHTLENANKRVRPYMGTATLPVKFENENKSATGGPSTMRIVCVAVKTEGQLLPDRKKRTEKFGLAGTEHTLNSTTDTPLMGFRPAQLVGSKANRKIIIPERWSLVTQGDPIVLKFFRRVVGATGGTWVQVPQTALEINSGLTGYTSGHLMLVDYYDQGAHSITAPDNFGYLGQHMKLDADGIGQEEWIITGALATSGGTSATVTMGYSWIELQ